MIKAIAIPVAFILVVIGVLALPAETVRKQAFTEWTWDTTTDGVAVEFQERESAEGHLYQLSMLLSQASVFVNASGVELLLATYGRQPLLRSGVLEFGDRCRFRTEAGSTLRDNSYLLFKPDQECIVTGGNLDQKNLVVTLELAEPSRVALWTTNMVSGGPYFSVAYIPDKADFLYPIGFFHPPAGPPMKRAELLGRLWGAGRGIRFVATVLGVAFFLGVLGVLLWRRGHLPIGAGLAFLAAASTFGVLTPPLQAPDEPDHLLSLARMSQNAQLEQSVLVLAQNAHFERIKFRSGEAFTTGDLSQTRLAPWSAHIGAVDSGRSRLAEVVWPRLAGFLPSTDGGTALLLLRFFNALIVAGAICFSLSVASAARVYQGRTSWLGLGFFWAPALPFFAMHFSNYAFILAGFVLQASAIPFIVSRGKLPVRASLMLGLGFGVAVYGGKLGVLALPAWIVILASKQASSTSMSRQERIATAASSYGATALGYLLIAIVVRVASSGHGPDPLSSFMQVELRASGLGQAFLVISGLALLVSPLFPRLEPSGRFLTKAKAYGPGLVLFFLVVTLVSSQGSVPSLDNGAAANVSLPLYARKVMQAFFFSVGLGSSNPLVVDTFYVGFGWLETQVPQGIVIICRILPALGLATFFSGRLIGDERLDNGVSLCAFFGLMVYLLALIGACHQVSITLHGRYLVGFYVLFLQLAFTALAGYPRKFAAAAFCLGVAMQGLSIIFLVDRYFQ